MIISSLDLQFELDLSVTTSQQNAKTEEEELSQIQTFEVSALNRTCCPFGAIKRHSFPDVSLLPTLPAVSCEPLVEAVGLTLHFVGIDFVLVLHFYR